MTRGASPKAEVMVYLPEREQYNILLEYNPSSYDLSCSATTPIYIYPPIVIEKSMTRTQHKGIVASGVAHLAFGPMPADQFIDEFFSSKLGSTIQSVFEEVMFKDLVGLFSGSYKESDMYQPFVRVLLQSRL